MFVILQSFFFQNRSNGVLNSVYQRNQINNSKHSILWECEIEEKYKKNGTFSGELKETQTFLAKHIGLL